jgi:hypothetical protein
LRRKLQIGGRVVNRIAPDDDQQFNATGIDIFDELS